ncbi:hypothetical protein CRE_18225 [Caenorhabditis remanei]|uniref:Uncharacterized protein n=1 Tax=Caenorhabditis remanei TaxID=31234 RepID=E3NCK5_CAERE|nr:hypothetical protein CRE_18225 [Caenorhabditis remanei]
MKIVFRNRIWHLSDFLHLESVARASHKNQECSPEFVKIITSEASEYGWDLYALIVSCAVLAVIVTVQTFYLLKGKGKNRKNKMRSKGRNSIRRPEEIVKEGRKRKNETQFFVLFSNKDE